MKKFLLWGWLLSATAAQAQSPALTWVNNAGGPGDDEGVAMAMDAAGNTYITGIFSGTVDFDPGPGTYSLTSVGTMDVFIMKTEASGTLAWVKNIGGTDNVVGFGIAVDASGNVITTGGFKGTADFDPGAGVRSLTSNGEDDIFLVKLDATGNYVWAGSMGSTLTEQGASITTDAAGNMYLMGGFKGAFDVDPGTATHTLTSNGGFDMYLVKLDPAGNFLWARQQGGPDNEYTYTVKITATGEILLCTSFVGTVDFDPGTSDFSLTSNGGMDMAFTKLNAAGDFVWAKATGGAQNDEAFAMTIDNAGNIYATGYFEGTADFDPGSGTQTLTGVANDDIFVLKLDAQGNYVWAKKMVGSGFNYGLGLTVDASSAVYITGFFSDKADFDPSAGTFYLTSKGDLDVHLAKLDAQGNFAWATSFGGTESDWGRCVGVDADGNVYATGFFKGTTDFDPSSGTHNLTSAGNEDFFLVKIKQDNSTGIGQISSPVITAFPNPVTDMLSLSFEEAGSYTIKIYNSIGIQVEKMHCEGSRCSIDISGYAAGLYSFTATCGDRIVANQKIMKR